MQDFTKALEDFSHYLRSTGKQIATAGSYIRDVQGFFQFMKLHSLTLNQLEPSTLLHYQEYMWANKAKINSIRRAFIGVRQFFRFLQSQDLLVGSPFEDVQLPNRDERLNFSLEHVDILHLISVAKGASGQLKTSRDVAIICLLAFDGLKASELISLKWQNLLMSGGLASLKVSGDRSRVIQVSRLTSESLEAYQEEINNQSSHLALGSPCSHMFVGFRGRDLLNPRPQISRHGLKFLLYELGNEAGLKGLNCEALRHYAMSHLIFLSRTPEEIMAHLGLRRIGNISKHLKKIDRKPEQLL